MEILEKEKIYIDKLNEQMREIEKLRAFISKARSESKLVEHGKSFFVIVPYWFMRDA